MSNLPTLYIPRQAEILEDNDQWQHRFEIRSESSNRIYIVAQNKKKKFWGCSCPGWKAHRRCKHLIAMELPCNEKPFEIENLKQ